MTVEALTLLFVTSGLSLRFRKLESPCNSLPFLASLLLHVPLSCLPHPESHVPLPFRPHLLLLLLFQVLSIATQSTNVTLVPPGVHSTVMLPLLLWPPFILTHLYPHLYTFAPLMICQTVNFFLRLLFPLALVSCFSHLILPIRRLYLV
jgi:hypothetical protein